MPATDGHELWRAKVADYVARLQEIVEAMNRLASRIQTAGCVGRARTNSDSYGKVGRIGFRNGNDGCPA